MCTAHNFDIKFSEILCVSKLCGATHYNVPTWIIKGIYRVLEKKNQKKKKIWAPCEERRLPKRVCGNRYKISIRDKWMNLSVKEFTFISFDLLASIQNCHRSNLHWSAAVGACTYSASVTFD